MSITKQKREEIKRYLLRHISQQDRDYIAKTQDAYGISKTTVYNYVRKLVESGAIQPAADERFPYQLVSINHSFVYHTTDQLEEDRIFDRDIAPLLQNLTRNVFDIWRYSFTEMMNNAIEHAEAATIGCSVVQNALYTDILIADDGVGIFSKIRNYYECAFGASITLDEAVATLFAGKFTTDQSRHSGEGIFFTSRAVDEFFILSEGKIFAHDVFSEAMAPIDDPAFQHGTVVLMRQEDQSNKDLKEIMDLYSDSDRGFFKTQLPVAHIFPNRYPVSRSEARRLGAMISKFEEVSLDFAGVERIGQGFAHELFVVFPAHNPNIQLATTNACPEVQGMIDRVIHTA